MSDVARETRTLRRRWAAPGGAHDRNVRILGILLPGAVGVMAAFLVLAPIFSQGDASFVLDKNKVAVARERMRTQRAQYRGADAKGRPFTLTAGSAVQQSSTDPVVRLNDLTAQIALDDGPARLVAQRGRYDMQREAVAVDGPIAFRGANGYQVTTRDAEVDLKTRRLTGTGPVSGQTPLGTFSGNGLSADLDGRVVRLNGNARLRIVPGRANRR